MLRLYDNHLSGNGYKPRLLMAHLGLTYERIELDILTGETRTPEFLALNPNGRIPLLVLEDGTPLAESNAILWYLAEGSRFLPAGRLDRALTLQWLFFEQYNHEPNIAVARHWLQHVGMTDAQRAQLPAKQEGGRAALAVMERHLDAREWFGGETMTVADIALYAYTHVADEGGFDPSPSIPTLPPGSPASRRSRGMCRWSLRRRGLWWAEAGADQWTVLNGLIDYGRHRIWMVLKRYLFVPNPMPALEFKFEYIRFHPFGCWNTYVDSASSHH